MNEQLMQLDISKSKYGKRKDDIIEVRIKNHEVLEVHFSKLVSLSNYIRDKYKYSEALNILTTDIEENLKENEISYESFEQFVKLIEDEKIKVPNEHIQNMYILSEIFDTPIITSELDQQIQEHLFKDLTFTIQTLEYYDKKKSNDQIKMTHKIEEYLSTRINECLSNRKFSELPMATISRILKKSGKDKIDHNLLVDFIIESIETRFVILIFVDISKMRTDKLEIFINQLDKEDEKSKEKYLEYLPFSLSFYKKMKNQKEEHLKSIQVKEEEHEKTKEKLKRTQNQLKHEEEEHEKTKEELKQTQNQLKHEEEEHEKTKIQLKQAEEELKRAKNEEEQNKIKIQKEIQKKIDEEKKQHLPSTVTVGGLDDYNQLGKSPNNKNERSMNPPQNFQLYPSPLLSFSGYGHHSVLITSDGSLNRIGYNGDGRISGSLEKRVIDHFTDFCMKDDRGVLLDPVSAVCSFYGTLYMFSKNGGKERQLVLCDSSINGGHPVFLDIGNHQPVSLFGGRYHFATICNEGEVIFINRNSVQRSPQTRIESVSLPSGEKASSVACCDDSFIVLSSKGRVFNSNFNGDKFNEFSSIEELSGKEIVNLSGTSEHFLAVSKEGRVFGRGSNEHGRLGIGEGISTVSSFTEISALDKYEIRSAYAGSYHSLFETREGKILSCGYNGYGRLLLSSGSNSFVYSPRETTITSGATFCIAGCYNSTVFIGNDPPPNTPNKRINEFD